MKSANEPSAKSDIKESLQLRWKTLLADDVRVEADGKVSVIGLYADDKLNINFPAGVPDPSKANPVLLEGVCILTIVMNLRVPTLFNMGLFNPSGQRVAKGSMTIEAGAVNHSISRFRPLPVSELGLWRLEFKDDSTSYDYFFSIVRPPALVEATPVKAARKTTRKRATS